MLRPTLKTIAFVSLTVMMLPVQLALRRAKLAQFYHKRLLNIMGIKITQVGEPQQAMFISNHTSWLDIIVLGSITPLSFIAKSEVASWPLFGLLAKLQNTIFVERKSPRKAIETLRIIDTASIPLVLFAEGTTGDGTCILPFNATLVKSPVQPVLICYRDKSTAWIGEMTLLPHIWAMFKMHEIVVTVEFHAPLNGERKVISNQSEKEIRQSHEKYHSLV